MKPREAYAFAASRMPGPVIAATLTRIAAFSPLLFWPGIVGQFMGYMPITLIATLSASLVAALIFTPTLGALIGKAHEVHHETKAARRPLHARPCGSRSAIPVITDPARHRPADRRAVSPMAGGSARASSSSPMSSRMSALVLVHARGNISLAEKDRYGPRSVETRVLDMPELSTVYARSGRHGSAATTQITEDVIGQIQFEFVDWQRAPAGGRDHGRDPGQDRRHSRHQGRGDGAAMPDRRPASRSRSSSPATTPRRCARRRSSVAGEPRQAAGDPRPRQRAADARHRLAAGDRQGGSREIRHRRRPASARRCGSSPTA